jgi:signal transduction histidine kinase
VIQQNNVTTTNPPLSDRLRQLVGSIRFRITIWFVAILALILGAFSLFIYFRQVQVVEAETSSRLSAQISQLGIYYRAFLHSADEHESEPGEFGALSRQDLPLLQPSDMLALLDQHGQIVQYSPNFPTESLPEIYQTWLASQNPSKPIPTSLAPADHPNQIAGQDTLFLLTNLDAEEGSAGVLVLGSPLDPGGQLPRLALTLSLVYILTLFVAFGGGYWLANQAMRPVQVITRTAQEIGERDLNRRLRLGRADELGQLADTFDEMLNRLQAAFERQRQFTADASHELRTPLTIIGLESDRALEQTRSADEYQNSLRIIQSENTRMSQLVDELLTLARMDSGRMAVQNEKLDLSEAVLDVVDRLTILAHKNQVALLTGELGEAPVWADQTLINHVLTNLVENGLKYAQGENAKVLVQTGSQERSAKPWSWLQVADNGPGIPESHLPHLFDRFYRIDAARTQGDDPADQATSGSGLGLAIVHAIVQMYGGQVEVQNRAGHGTIFTVWLPSAD